MTTALTADQFRPGDRVEVQYGGSVVTGVVIRPVNEYLKIQLYWGEEYDNNPDYPPMIVFVEPKHLVSVTTDIEHRDQ